MTDPISLLIYSLFAVFALWELLRPARSFPRRPWWHLRGLLFFVYAMYLGGVVPLIWDGWLSEHSLIDARGLGHVGGAVVGLLVLQLVLYVWHRSVHEFDFLWRWSHQMHHSAERVDLFGAFLFHPMDIVGLSLVSSVSLVWILGLTVPAAIGAMVFTMFMTIFQHSNIRTPHWLGYLVQRPEAHCIHHERGVHAYNYADLPVVDMIFGTFRNPRTFEGEVGFYQGASARLLPMLFGRDVGTAPEDLAAEVAEGRSVQGGNQPVAASSGGSSSSAA